MKNRMLPFGYIIRGGELLIDKTEAVYVKEIFEKRANGTIYSEIASELDIIGIPFYETAGWDKHKVKRVIENERYIGKDGYPSIISKELFQKARAYKYRKPAKAICTDEVQKLKPRVVCGVCGAKMKHWCDSRKKAEQAYWTCSECSSKVVIQDEELPKLLLKAIKQLQGELSDQKSGSSLHISPVTPEIRILENRITRLLGEHDRNIEETRKLIMEWTALRYDAMKNTMCDNTERIRKLMDDDGLESYNSKLAGTIIQTVILEQTNAVTARFINGMEITIGKENNNVTVSCECEADTCKA